MQWKGVLSFELDKKSMENETITWLEVPNRGKANVEQILGPEGKNEFKIAGPWELQ